MTSQQLAQQTGIPRRAIDEIRALPMKYKLDRVIHLCFELSWKVMKEYLTEAGFSASSTGSSRTIIKTAYEAGLITDQEVWLSMLADRNDTSHE